MYKLIIEDDEGKTTVVPLIRDEISIGRKEGNTIRLTERNISRRHAKLIKQNGAVFIEDLASYNGIKVNGNKINGRVAVAEGDRIQIGDYVLGLKVEGQAKAAAKPSLSSANGKNNRSTESTTAELGAVSAEAVEAASTTDVGTAAEGRTPYRDKAARVDAARIVCVSSNFAGVEFTLSKPTMVIGRVDDNDIVVNHRSISRHHSRIEEEHGRYTIIDMQSANGVRVNGEQYGKVELRKGDLVDLGHVRLRFVAPGEDFVFSRDATVVDISSVGPARGSVWVAVAVVVAAIVAVLIWRLMTNRTGDPTSGQQGMTQAQGDGASADSAEEIERRLRGALVGKEWQRASEHCQALSKVASTSASATRLWQRQQAPCKHAAVEATSKQAAERGDAALTRNEYSAALAHYLKIHPKSEALETTSASRKRAVDNYNAQVQTAVAEFARKHECAAARARGQQAKALFGLADGQAEDPFAGQYPADDPFAGDEKGLDVSELDKRLAACKPAVVALATPSDAGQARTGGGDTSASRRVDAVNAKPVTPRRRPVKRRIVRRRKPQPVAPKPPTAEERAEAKVALQKAWKAYSMGYYKQAMSVARKALKVLPNNPKALAVVGASACYLKRARKAKEVYRKLDTQRRNLLRSVCSRTGVELQ